MSCHGFNDGHRRRRVRRILVAWLLVLVAVAWSQADVVDRIVAIVGGQAITLSDVRAARALGLVQADADTSDDAIVDRLIVRELMRTEVDRFSLPPSDAGAIEDGVRAARQRLRATDRAADPLDALGMTELRLRAWIDDDRRIERYLQQRFDAAAQPTDDEVLTFFQSREREFVEDGQPQPFASAREEARARLTIQRRRQMIDEWVAGLRRRATIVLVPR